MNIQPVNINELDLTLQTRAETDSSVAAEYAADMREGQTFPPVTVFSDGEHKYLADGFHRLAAMRALNLTECRADIIGGDRAAALTYALKANAIHGLRRSNADKRHALEVAWENRDILFKGEEPTCRSLAAICCVHHDTAADFLQLKRVSDSDKTDHNESKSERGVKKNLKEGNDRFGVKIPENLLPAFKCQEIQEIFKMVRNARLRITNNFDQSNIAFAALGQQVLINLDNASTNLKFAAPYCVCRTCRGEGCYRCKDRGFMTRIQYNALPHEFKHQGAE